MNFEKSVAIGRWFRRRAENVAVALLALMFICFILQIIYRYLLDDPLGWSEEVIMVTWLWSVLWGAAFVVGEVEEIRFDIIYTHMPETYRRASTVMTGIALIVLYGVSLPAAYRYVSFMRVEHSAYLHVPVDRLYSIYIIFSAACICRYCWLVYHAIRGDKSPSTDPAKVSD